MAKQRRPDQRERDTRNMDEVGAEGGLPEAAVGQSERQRQGLGQPDESGFATGMGKVEGGEPAGGMTPEHSGQGGGARNSRGRRAESIADRDTESIADRDTESIADRDTESIVDRDTEIRRETDFRGATATPFDEDEGGRKVTREDDLFGREGKA